MLVVLWQRYKGKPYNFGRRRGDGCQLFGLTGQEFWGRYGKHELPFELINRLNHEFWTIQLVKQWGYKGKRKSTAISLLPVILAKALAVMTIKSPVSAYSSSPADFKPMGSKETKITMGKEKAESEQGKQDGEFEDARDYFSLSHFQWWSPPELKPMGSEETKITMGKKIALSEQGKRDGEFEDARDYFYLSHFHWWSPAKLKPMGSKDNKITTGKEIPLNEQGKRARDYFSFSDFDW